MSCETPRLCYTAHNTRVVVFSYSVEPAFWCVYGRAFYLKLQLFGTGFALLSAGLGMGDRIVMSLKLRVLLMYECALFQCSYVCMCLCGGDLISK